MTKQQHEREKLLQMRAARDAELRMLAQGRTNADPRYVQDVVDFLWQKLLDRKFEQLNSLRTIERQRLHTLAAHYSLA